MTMHCTSSSRRQAFSSLPGNARLCASEPSYGVLKEAQAASEPSTSINCLAGLQS